MPLLKYNKKSQKVKIKLIWISIPVKSTDTIPLNEEHYLVNERVAEYIEKLEKLVTKLPTLKKK